MFKIYYQKNITYISRWRSVRRLKIKEVDQGYHMGMGSAKSMKHNVLNSDLEIQSDVFGEIVEVTLGSLRPTNRKIFYLNQKVLVAKVKVRGNCTVFDWELTMVITATVSDGGLRLILRSDLLMIDFRCKDCVVNKTDRQY